MNAVTLDVIVLVAIGVAMIRGWTHGSIREFFSLLGLLAGMLAAPLLVGPLTIFIRDVSNIDVNVARVIALAVVVGVLSIGGAIIGVRTARGIEVAGPRTLDRIGGTMFALVRALILTSLFLYGAIAVSTGGSNGSLTSAVGNSASGQLLANPDSPFTVLYDGLLSRSDDLRALTLWVRQKSEFDERVPGDRLDFAATNEHLGADSDAEQRMFELLNRERIDRGLDPLTWCEPCAEVARDHSKDMYRHGYFSHVDPEGDDPFDRMRGANISYQAAGENLSIAPSISKAHASLMESPDHRENILRDLFDQAGIGCVQGPYGLMCTQVFRATNA